MLRATVIAVVLLLATAQAGFAVKVMGAGALSCGAWTTDRRDPNGAGANHDVGWVLGFLSGANIESESSTPDFLDGTDSGGIVAYMDNYCGAHPLDPLWKGAVQLRIELGARANRKK